HPRTAAGRPPSRGRRSLPPRIQRRRPRPTRQPIPPPRREGPPRPRLPHLRAQPPARHTTLHEPRRRLQGPALRSRRRGFDRQSAEASGEGEGEGSTAKPLSRQGEFKLRGFMTALKRAWLSGPYAVEPL